MAKLRQNRPHIDQSADASSELTPFGDELREWPSREGNLANMQFEVALYIETISAELRAMTQAVKLDSLAYFLEMARVEASIDVERLAKQKSPP